MGASAQGDGGRLRPILAGPLRAAILAALGDREIEVFHATFFDAQGASLGGATLSLGGRCGVEVRCRELFRRAFKLDAATMIVAHNHPSSDPRPSVADRAVTRELLWIGQRLEVAVLDHVIVAGDLFYSMKRGRLL